MPAKKTQKEAREYYSRRDAQMIGVYTKAVEKTLYRCDRGHEWMVTPNKIQQGRRCPTCYGANIPITLGKVESCLSPRGLRLVGPLVGARDKTKFSCEFGHEWTAQLSAVMYASGCPTCSRKKAAQRLRKNPEEILQKIRSTGFEVADKYVDTNTKLKLRCHLGHEWDARVHNVLKGHGCPQCAHKKAKTKNMKLSAVFDAEIRNKPLQRISEYNGAHIKTSFKCLQCKTTWRATPSKILNGRGCPSCAATGFDSTKAGVFYVIKLFNELTNKTYLKVGITNKSVAERFRKLPKTTKIIDVVREDWFQIGRRAADTEIEVKKTLKDFQTRDSGFMGHAQGETECYDLEELPT